MTFGSLFAGIGGLDLGLERAGMECAWQVEIDPFCRKVLAKHWPDVPKYEDVTEVGAHNLEPVDLICGGFPCQDLSYAGKGAGIEGERSGLWTEYARIVRELQPRYVLVENVPALLGRGMGRVLGDLAASGYDAEWDCIPAAAVGAPHRRDRAFILAHSNNTRRRTPEVFGSEREGAFELGDDGEEEPTALGNPQGLFGNGGNNHTGGSGESTAPPVQPRGPGSREGPNGGWWSIEPNVGRVANGVPSRVDRLRGLGNAVVPQVAEFIGRRIMEAA